MERLTDEELIERCQAADAPAAGEPFLNVLFQRHHGRVASWCYYITGDTNSAVDLAQEIFIKAFQGIGSFRRGSKFTTWLYSITRNHCLDDLRSRKRQVQEVTTLTDDLEDWEAARADSIVEKQESRELMQKLIRESLDETETKVMTLHYVHELQLDTVSRMLGLSNVSGAKAYIVSARRKLRRAHEIWNHRANAAKAGRHAE